MRYTSSHPHAFRNRIAKSIGVLVAAALVATLGLPVRRRHRSTKPKGITSTMATGFDGHVGAGRALTDGFDINWIVTFTSRYGTKVVVVLTWRGFDLLASTTVPLSWPGCHRHSTTHGAMR